ncbi:hypothetical protein OVY01_21950 [Robbsia sp. Bb-Pol-6]|uniref:Copper resistance protein D domain-containing protein n=1 Tax=Robbsia betulipollinis TaxID=2981849 RepID=A0ABT3ZVD9_9BURK|nr:hypothetical protein [Robbsia betulipollinis]MCY0389808.1 hypothetical protein [Robbsia betulipollinis]
MIEPLCRYIAIFALLVRIGMSFYMGRTMRKEANGLNASAQTSARTLRSALLFMNIWVAIALTFWLTALLHAELSPDAL